MMRSQNRFAIAIVVSLVLALPIAAAETRGKVASVRPEVNQFVLTEAFKNLTFEVNNSSRVYVNGRESKLADIQPGDEAAVVFDKQGKRLIANVVRCNRIAGRVSEVAVAVLMGTTFLRQPPAAKNGADHHQHLVMMRACAKACSDCQRECDECAAHCAHMLQTGDKKHMTTLMTCQDCANVCAAASHIVARGGPFAGLVCEPCAEACARCAKACEAFPDNERMKRCAEECRKCEKACREMVKHMGHLSSK